MPRRRTACLVMVMLPFWTSILVKSFALVAVFGNQGLVNQLLGFLSGGQIDVPQRHLRAACGGFLRHEPAKTPARASNDNGFAVHVICHAVLSRFCGLYQSCAGIASSSMVLVSR